MFDIDNFKKINDTYGHDMGDEVLVRLSQKAKSLIREEDSIGRWGGEEFMILLPESSKAEAVEKDDLTSLYKRVDERLYYAKTHGKNQVVSSDGKD
ncbi:MAG: GGDEF domain-containing protein [Treponema sp.]|nr:GGDEF domain-containing protein [Treponema sp.]